MSETLSAPITFLNGRVTLHHGDVLDALKAVPDASVHAVATDPPYHLTSIQKRFAKPGQKPARSTKTGAYARAAAGFMGKAWDGGDIAFRPDVWRECFRVLKPGGYILAFASTRGFGHMQVAIEEVGFITHPMILWVFGSGFPKAHNAARAVNKAHGLQGEAAAWGGYHYGGQALKPACEPIYMGQKPFAEKNGALNLMKHGAGALNIDACRVEAEKPTGWGGAPAGGNTWNEENSGLCKAGDARPSNGRWPANLIHDGSEEVLAAFPDTRSGSIAPHHTRTTSKTKDVYGERAAPPEETLGDSGSAARFFYSAKADANDRIGSRHPTVKPVDLMRYLVRLVTPKGGTVLDPFSGTGTTGEAAFYEGFNAILVEREAEYIADIKARMALCLAGPDERKRKIAKRKSEADDAGPLFEAGAP